MQKSVMHPAASDGARHLLAPRAKRGGVRALCGQPRFLRPVGAPHNVSRRSRSSPTTAISHAGPVGSPSRNGRLGARP